jgi:hypothetical protein
MRRSFLADICHNPRQSSHADDNHARAGAGAQGGASASGASEEEEGAEEAEEAEEEDFFREVEEGMAGISEALGKGSHSSTFQLNVTTYMWESLCGFSCV